MSKYESEIYNNYIKSKLTYSFEDYLYEEYNLMKFYFEQSNDWADDLGKLLYDIHVSGLLKGTDFDSKLEGVYTALEA